MTCICLALNVFPCTWRQVVFMDGLAPVRVAAGGMSLYVTAGLEEDGGASHLPTGWKMELRGLMTEGARPGARPSDSHPEGRLLLQPPGWPLQQAAGALTGQQSFLSCCSGGGASVARLCSTFGGFQTSVWNSRSLFSRSRPPCFNEIKKEYRKLSEGRKLNKKIYLYLYIIIFIWPKSLSSFFYTMALRRA